MDDDSILALLADTDTPRQVPAHQVWSDSALVDAWSAAIHEFAVSLGYVRWT